MSKICHSGFSLSSELHLPPIPDAYEKALLGCMLGNHMLFNQQDSVELCWSFLTSILKEYETCADRGEIILLYDSET
jgi:glucose-6-phosphate 1-dehydrogenase